MTSREFCYWLQGYFELAGGPYGTLTEAQVAQIEKHLAMVFKHEIDPSYPDAKALNKIHTTPFGPKLRC